MYKIILFALILTLSAPFPAKADFGSGMDNCYRHIDRYVPARYTAQPLRELYVLIDQTVVPDDKLKLEVINKVLRYVRRGDRVSVATFSAYATGHYTEFPFSGTFDIPLAENARNDIPTNDARKFDRCIKKQWGTGRKLMLLRINEAFTALEELHDFTHTELIGALNDLTKGLVGKSRSEARTLLVFTDALENSALLSMFKSGDVRLIDPQREIARVGKAGMIPDLGGVRAYVIGAGWTANGSLYIDSRKLTALREFWERFFAASKASLEGFGEPMLPTDMD